MAARRFWITTLVAVAAGVALRFVYVLAVVRGRIGLTGDALTYHQLGELLAGGHGYVRPDAFAAGQIVPTAEFPPVFPLLLAALDAVGIDQPTGQRLVGALLGGLTILVVALLAAAVAGQLVGAVAAWIAALYPQLVVFDGSLLSEGLYALLVALTVLGVVRARQIGDWAAGRRWWILASAAAGLAALTRTEGILLVPLLVVPATRAIAGGGRAWARAALLASAGTLALLGVWTVRNAVALDHFVPLTNNSGTMLSGANCDAVYSGVQIGGWRFDCVRPLDDPAAETPGDGPDGGFDETRVAAARRSAGLDYMRDHVGEVPAVMAVRVARTFGAWDIRSNLFFESLEGRDYHWLWAAWYAWLVLAPLAVAGAVLQRRARRELWPVLVPVAIVLVTSLVSYGNQRFRMAAEPSIVVLAAIGAVGLARAVTSRTIALGDGSGDDGSPQTARRARAVTGRPGPLPGDAGQAQAPGGSS